MPIPLEHRRRHLSSVYSYCHESVSAEYKGVFDLRLSDLCSRLISFLFNKLDEDDDDDDRLPNCPTTVASRFH